MKQYLMILLVCFNVSLYSMHKKTNDDIEKEKIDRTTLNPHRYIVERSRSSRASQVDWRVMLAEEDEERAKVLGRSMAVGILTLGDSLGFISKKKEMTFGDSKVLLSFIVEYHKDMKYFGFTPDFDETAKQLCFKELIAHLEKEKLQFSAIKNFGDEKDRGVPVGIQLGSVPWSDHKTFYSGELTKSNARGEKRASVIIQQNGVNLDDVQWK